MQQNKSDINDEPVNLIVDKVAVDNSVYNLCSKKFANLIKHPSEKQFFEIVRELDNTDKYKETLLYNLVAANKLGIDVANIRIANCLTQSLSNPYVGKNSKEIALFYLKKGEFATKHKRGQQIIERFESLSTDKTEFIVPVITYKSSEIQRLKAGSLKGSVEDRDGVKTRAGERDVVVEIHRQPVGPGVERAALGQLEQILRALNVKLPRLLGKGGREAGGRHSQAQRQA